MIVPLVVQHEICKCNMEPSTGFVCSDTMDTMEEDCWISDVQCKTLNHCKKCGKYYTQFTFNIEEDHWGDIQQSGDELIVRTIKSKEDGKTLAGSIKLADQCGAICMDKDVLLLMCGLPPE